MNDSFSEILNSYNESKIEEFKQGVSLLAKISFVWFQEMKNAGFNDSQALGLTIGYQRTLLSGTKSQGDQDEQ